MGLRRKKKHSLSLFARNLALTVEGKTFRNVELCVLPGCYAKSTGLVTPASENQPAERHVAAGACKAVGGVDAARGQEDRCQDGQFHCVNR